MLYLELVVNEQSSGQVVPVQMRDGHFLVAAGTLRELQVRAEGAANALVAVDQIPGVTLEYDSPGQRLLLMVPPDWLPAQQIGGERRMLPITATNDQGLLLNYDLYASGLEGEQASASLWSEQRMFGSYGVISNTGVYSRAFRNNAGEYMRYDTRWVHSDPEQIRTITVGDLVTGTLPWGSAARLGGIQVARNFAIRPDLVTYPLPRFSGQAAVPSAVDLFINGYRASSETAQPGPFTLNTTPFINGAGEASIVTTDALGRQVLTTIPFYVANTLLKPDTTDYALAAGALRLDYGAKNFAYGEMAATAAYRRGINEQLTLEARGEFSKGLTLVGAGGVVSLNGLGVVNLSLTESQSDAGQAQQWNYGYQYSAQHFGFSAQQTLRGAGYADLGTLGASAMGRQNQRSTVLNVSGSMGGWGTLSLAYFDVLAQDNQQTQIAALNYTRPINSRNFLSVYLTHAPNTGESSLQMQWTAVFDTLGSLSLTRNNSRQSQGNQLQYSRSPSPAGGLGWNMAYANGGGQADYRQISATWRATQAQLQAGVYSQGSLNSSWFGASGSIVAMDGDVFAANRINDAFALVSTSGVEGVQLRFENQLIGYTDKKGHLLVTGINAYYPSRFEIDTLDLPNFMVAPKTEQRIVLPAGSGALLRFEITQVLAASFTLTDTQGQPLPVGMQVEHVGTGQRAVVGWDGQVYLEGLRPTNELLVTGANRPSCRVRFSLKADKPGVLRLGALVCQPNTTFASLDKRHVPRFTPAATGFPS